MAKQYLVDIDISIGQDVIEIKQIPSFSTLVKGAEFRAKQLLQMIGGHLTITTEPLAFNGKWLLNQSQHIEMLTAVDFDFETNLNDGRDFRIDSEEKRIAVATLFDDFVRLKERTSPSRCRIGLMGPGWIWTRSMSSLNRGCG